MAHTHLERSLMKKDPYQYFIVKNLDRFLEGYPNDEVFKDYNRWCVENEYQKVNRGYFDSGIGKYTCESRRSNGKRGPRLIKIQRDQIKSFESLREDDHEDEA